MKNRKILTILLILGVLCVGVFFIAGKLGVPGVNHPSTNEPNTTVSSNANAKDWLTYENDSLGISFAHPKLVQGKEMVFFQVGNILFVTVNSSNIYVHRDEIMGDSDEAILEKESQLEKNIQCSGLTPHGRYGFKMLVMIKILTL